MEFVLLKHTHTQQISLICDQNPVLFPFSRREYPSNVFANKWFLQTKPILYYALPKSFLIFLIPAVNTVTFLTQCNYHFSPSQDKYSTLGKSLTFKVAYCWKILCHMPALNPMIYPHLLLAVAFFLIYILALLDHQPYGRFVLWVNLLLTAHIWRYNNYI